MSQEVGTNDHDSDIESGGNDDGDGGIYDYERAGCLFGPEDEEDGQTDEEIIQKAGEEADRFSQEQEILGPEVAEENLEARLEKSLQALASWHPDYKQEGPTRRKARKRNAPKGEVGGGVSHHVSARAVAAAGEARPEGGGEREGREAGGEPECAGDRGAGADSVRALARGLAEIAEVLDGTRRWCVVQADCLRVMACLPDRCVAHVITDPPYESEAHTLQRRIRASESRGATWQKTGGVLVVEPLDFVPITPEQRASAGKAFARVAVRWSLVFCQVEAAMKWRECLSDASYRRTCIWHKPDGMPQLTGDRPGMGYESIVACHRRGRSAWNGGGRVGVYVHNKQSAGNTTQPHPTTKPLPLMLDLVTDFTSPDDVILDPFAGSGTTGVAAIRLGRRAILIEKDEKYARVCVERMAAEANGSTLAAARAGQTPLFGAT